jgi:hypothetical protein
MCLRRGCGPRLLLLCCVYSPLVLHSSDVDRRAWSRSTGLRVYKQDMIMRLASTISSAVRQGLAAK